MNDEAYFWHADKHRSVLQADTVILGVCNHIVAICPEKHGGVKLIFCLQMNTKKVDSITLGLRSHA